jgi:hypothetical protein
MMMRGVSRRRSLSPQRSRAASEYRITASLFSMMLFVACSASTAATTHLDGVWGGAHELLTIGADSATLDVPCATARIEHPIIVDAGGRFDVDASWTTIRPVVPAEGDRRPLKETVRIRGEVRADELALTVHFTDPNRMSEQFTMTRGRTTRVPLCAQIHRDDRRRTA